MTRLRLVARTELRSRTKATSSLPTKDGGVVVEVGVGVATATACAEVERAHPLCARCIATGPTSKWPSSWTELVIEAMT